MYNEASTAIPTLQQLSINRTRLLVVSGVSSEWVYNLSVDTFTKEQSNLSKTETWPYRKILDHMKSKQM
jgi:hypothetical protein